MNRRELIRIATSAAALQALPRAGFSQSKPSDNPFKLGTASGSPTPDGVVLWTKLVSDSLFGYGDKAITVTWQVAHDDKFERIALQGTATALPQLGHAVHAELRGLQADRWYFYRFIHGEGASAHISNIGRTRTAPALDSKTAKLRFAFASCQRWEHGHYAAYRQLVQDNPDLIVFLGDYIYEYASPRVLPPNFVRSHSLRKAVSLADYRDRYALHKSDPLLQAAHAACPWLVTWDDHEVQNDYATDQSEGLTPQQDFLTQRAAAYQAFYEHMPLPASALARGLAGLGGSAASDGVRVTQRMQWGQLASFHLLDCRQFRDYQVCPRPNRGGSNMVLRSECVELKNSNRTLLGKAQEAWLAEGLALDAKHGVPSSTIAQPMPWSIIAQSTLLAQIEAPAGKERKVWTDGWEGYPFARQRLLDSLAAQPALHPVVLSGDVHLNVVAAITVNPESPTSAAIATEFCGTSLTSHTSWHPEREPSFYGDNPSVKYFNSEKRGYALAEVTPKLWTTTLMGVEDVRSVDSAVKPIVAFAVERGNVQPQRV
jgi:alkaline phosphatase D